MSRFYTVSLKRNIVPIIFVIFLIGLVLFSRSNLYAAKAGLKLWANNVVPSLFPFFIATNLLGHTNVVNHISKRCNRFMRPIFNVPGQSAYALLLGIISGYPVGSKIVTDLRNSNLFYGTLPLKMNSFHKSCVRISKVSPFAFVTLFKVYI